MRLLTRDEILAAQDLVFEDVVVAAWGGSVRVRAMTGRERDDLRAGMDENKNIISAVHAQLLSVTLSDDAGNRLFTADDVNQLREKSAAALDAVFAVAMRLNGMDSGAVATAVKNSAAGQKGDFGTG